MKLNRQTGGKVFPKYKQPIPESLNSVGSLLHATMISIETSLKIYTYFPPIMTEIYTAACILTFFLFSRQLK